MSFIGQDGDYVASGSDDGNVFIWDKNTAEIVNCIAGKNSTDLRFMSSR